LLPANAHAGSEKNKATARKIDNLITIPNRSGIYRTTSTDLQEHVCIVLNNPVAGYANLKVLQRVRPAGPWLQHAMRFARSQIGQFIQIQEQFSFL
jgi:hypothetical protein